MPTIFDFDQTITLQHTFGHNHIQAPKGTTTSWYEVGKEQAKTNVKQNIEHYLKHDKDNLSAIATFHNNHELVAGYVAAILKKELIYQLTETHDNIALAFYKVTGEDNSFCIAYIPFTGEKFQQAKSELGNKNFQIEEISAFWANSKLINGATGIDFYDDDRKNIAAADFLPFINAHHVTPDSLTLLAPLPLTNTRIIPQGEALLNKLFKKCDDLSAKYGWTNAEAFNAACALHTSLEKEFFAFTFGKQTLTELKNNCESAIQRAHVTLDPHRGWTEFLANLTLGILTLGVGILIKGAVNWATNKPFLFFTRTDSAQLLDNVEQEIVSLSDNP